MTNSEQCLFFVSGPKESSGRHCFVRTCEWSASISQEMGISTTPGNRHNLFFCFLLFLSPPPPFSHTRDGKLG